MSPAEVLDEDLHVSMGTPIATNCCYVGLRRACDGLRQGALILANTTRIRPCRDRVHQHTEASKLVPHTGDERTNNILRLGKLVPHTGEVPFTYIQCSEPSSFPNVLPEGLEQTIRMIDVLMPWGIAWLVEAPIWGQSPSGATTLLLMGDQVKVVQKEWSLVLAVQKE